MAETLLIGDGTVVAFHYRLSNDAGDVLDSSEGKEPLSYLQGAGNIVPGLERQMKGHVAGDAFEAVVPPAEGYGDRQPVPAQALSRSSFPEGVELQAGMGFIAQGPSGQDIPLFIVSVGDDEVKVDVDHPLAGETLHFNVEVVSVRAASDEEKQHGHPHGPEGHGHHHG